MQVHLATMQRTDALTFISGEDRPASLVVYGKHLFVGFGSAWAEGTSSVVKVDIARARSISAAIPTQAHHACK
jgi:hypothetical protein